MRITDDHGQGLRKPHGARLVTPDGRLLWVGPIERHEHHEFFFLDGKNLGCISLEQAMDAYNRAPPSNAPSSAALHSVGLNEWLGLNQTNTMTKPELLRLIRLLSAIESWALSQEKRMPDYLHDDLSATLDAIHAAILLPDAPNA